MLYGELRPGDMFYDTLSGYGLFVLSINETKLYAWEVVNRIVIAWMILWGRVDEYWTDRITYVTYDRNTPIRETVEIWRTS